MRAFRGVRSSWLISAKKADLARLVVSDFSRRRANSFSACFRRSMASCSFAVRSSTCASTWRSEEHTSELQSLMRISYAVFCLKKKKNNSNNILKKNTNQTLQHTDKLETR